MHTETKEAAQTMHSVTRLTQWSNERWATETYCCGHWWIGNLCLYGGHDLAASKDANVATRQERIQ